MRLTIAKAMMLFGLMACIGVLFVVGLAAVALGRLEVTGPIYTQIAYGKDLLGDILPPPEYVIEAYLEANLAVQDPAHLADHKAKLIQLHKDYDDRRAYWRASGLPDDIKSELTQISDAQVQTFWRAVETGLIPALERSDAPSAARSMQDVTQAYLAHRKLIDDIVAKSNAFDTANELQAKTELNRYQWLMFGGGALVLAMIIAGVLAIRRHVVAPISRMTSYMAELAEGALNREVPYRDRADEIGAMAKSVDVFRGAVRDRGRVAAEQETERSRIEAERANRLEQTQRADHERTQAVARLAESLKLLSQQDLTGDIDDAFPAQYAALRQDFNAALVSLRQTLQAIIASASVVSDGAHNISQAADDLSRRTEQQAAALEQTAAALDQITATVRQTSLAADERQGAVNGAMATARDSEAVVDSAMQAMAEIESSSSHISQIIGVIDEIAFQTNLLALNAGVEAARAGESGRGFAVVAQEVRALAQRSAEAAKQIKALIGASSHHVSDGVSLVGATTNALRSIVDQVGRINDLVATIAGSAREQSASLHEVNRAVNEMDHVTQQNAAMVEETTAASHDLRSEAAELGRLIEGFKTEGPEAGGQRRRAIGRR